MIPPNTSFDKHTRAPVHHFFIHFHVNYTTELLPSGFYTVPVSESVKKEIREVTALLKSGQTETPRFHLLTHVLVAQALTLLSNKIQSPGYDNKRLLLVIDYMQEHLGEPLFNSDLARLSGMTTNAFINFFKQKTRIPPMKYFVLKRLEKALSLLQFSRLSIDQIAHQTAFCDRNHFTKLFIRQYKTGPSAFRKKAWAAQ
jgi:transcriptional regulator GlxA family with amidase domain